MLNRTLQEYPGKQITKNVHLSMASDPRKFSPAFALSLLPQCRAPWLPLIVLPLGPLLCGGKPVANKNQTSLPKL